MLLGIYQLQSSFLGTGCSVLQSAERLGLEPAGVIPTSVLTCSNPAKPRELSLLDSEGA